MINPVFSTVFALSYTLMVSFLSFSYLFLLPLLIIFFDIKNLFKTLKKLFFLNFFITLIALFLYFETTLKDASSLFLRVNFILLFNLTLFSSSNLFEIPKALSIFKLPKQLIATLYFTIIFINYLTNELKNIRQTLLFRGFTPKNSLFTLKTFGSIFGYLFLKLIYLEKEFKQTLIFRDFKGDLHLNPTLAFSYKEAFLTLVFLLTAFLKFLYG
ncbi:MAG: hypothetical protein WCR62_00885 [Sulfurospirillaceae bacterium]|jgi:cobalt/nickel transport system permease protein